MSWTEDRISLLRKLWAFGLSANQVAAELGGISRNAVIGKIHHLGIEDRSGVKKKPARNADAFYEQQKKKRTPLRRQLPIKPEPVPVLEPQPGDEVDLDYNDGAFVCESTGVDIVGLKPDSCRWPLGDPRTESFSYCGAPRVGNGGVFDVYCAHHARIAYAPKPKPVYIPKRMLAR